MKEVVFLIGSFYLMQTAFAQSCSDELQNAGLMGCIEIPPQYRGGTKAMKKLFQDSVSLPEEVLKKGLSARISVTYMIDTCGSISHVQVSESAGSSLDEEAVRLISMLKSWIPATLNGNKINYYQSQPIVFRIGPDRKINKIRRNRAFVSPNSYTQ